MKKYVRISLVLTCICLICALAVAGVNYITAPIIEKNAIAAKMEAYKQVFPELDEEKSKFVNDGFKSSYVKEKLEAKNANDELLGYAFNASGKNTYGPITLVVGFSIENVDGKDEAKLIDVILTENGQTGGRNEMINTWIDSFESGMTSTEVQNVPTYAGATIGSNLVKNMLNACLAELGIKTPVQEKLEKYFGESVSMDKSKADDLVHYANQLATSYTVKDQNDELLGYYFEYKTTDGIKEIALDKDLNVLPNIEVSPLELEVVKAEVANNFSEDLAVKVMFGENTTSVETEFTLPADADVEKYMVVNDAEGNKLGSYVIAQRENTYGLIKLLVGINADKTLNSLFIVDATQTIGKNAQLSEFVNDFDSGMVGTDCLNVGAVSGATFAANTTKDIIADAFEIATGERPFLGYDDEYKSLFDGVDLSKSKDITEFSDPTDDGKFTEGKELYDASGNLLGYGFILESTPNKYDGVLTVIVGVQPNGKLQKAKILANGQTSGWGDKLNGYEDKFTPGMGTSDITNVPNAGATLGSEQFKALVLMAMKEVGSYEEFYLQGFPEMTSFVAKDNISNSAILEGVTVYKGEEVLGNAYIVRVENVFSWHIFMVALDNEGKLIKVVDVDNFHPGDGEKADITEQLGAFTSGMTYEDVLNTNFDVIAHATYTIEQIRLGIKIAMVENNAELQNQELEEEIYLKQLFPNAVFDKSEKLASTTNSGIVYGYKVWSSEMTPSYQPLGFVGYAYFIEVENNDISLKLLVGVDMNGNFVNAILVDMETKVVLDPTPGIFGDTLRGRIEQYLKSFTLGMTEYDIKRAQYLESAGYASQLVKYAIRLAMNESKNAKLDNIDLYQNNEFYQNNIENIDLSKSESLMTEEFKKNNPLIVDAIIAKSANIVKIDNGKPVYETLGYVYIVDVLGIYSHNYVLVVLNPNGTLNKIYDIENNHGSLSSVTEFFTNGMTLEDVNNISIHPTPESHSSFTIEQGKLAVKVAMQANGVNNEAIQYELAAKTLYPFMVEARSEVITSDISDKTITFAEKVYGTDISTYTDGALLGYVFVTAKDNLKAMIAVDRSGNYDGAYVLSGEASAFADVEIGSTLDDIKANNDISAEVKDILVRVLTESRNHLELTAYDSFIKKAFPTFSAFYSKVSESKKIFEETELVVDVYSKDSKKLGKFVVNKIENGYSWHQFGVALAMDNTLVNAFNIKGHHPGDPDNLDPNIDDKVDLFKPGMTLEDVSNVKIDAIGHATFTIEQVRLGIKLAIKEAMNITDLEKDIVFLEKAVKMTFPLAIWDKSTKLEVNDSRVLYATKVVGTKDFDANSKDLGYAYIVKIENGYSWHIFGVALDLDGKLIQVVDINNYHGADGDKADISDKLALFKEGMSLIDVENIKFDAIGHATFTIEQIRLGVKIAMSCHQKNFNENLNNEIALKTIFDLAIWDRSEVLNSFNNENIKYGLKVMGTEGFDGTPKHIGYAYIVELNGLKAMIGLSADNTLKGVYDMNTKELVENNVDYQALIDIALQEGGNK